MENAHQTAIWCVSFCEDERLLTGSLDGALKLWHKSLGKAIGTTVKQRVGVTSLVSGGTSAAACFQDSTIRFYTLTPEGIEEVKVENDAGQLVADVFNPGHLEAWSISLAADKATFATGSNSGVVSLWSMEAGHDKLLSFETNDKPALCTGFSAYSENQQMACGSMDGTVYVFDVLNQTKLQTIQEHNLPTRCVKFSPDGNLVYSASDDRHVSVVDARSGVVINAFAHSGMAFSVDVSPDHRHFCVGSSDHVVSLWDLGMQRCETTYHCHSDQVWGVAFDPMDATGRRFASVGDDQLLQLYE